MEKYQKIKNLFKFDYEGKIEDYVEEFKYLKDIEWFGTEKIDGTNIRVYWNGYNIQIAGRTENSQIPSNLQKKLNDIFLRPEIENILEQLFGEKEAILFGEGYGYKIQKNGEKYIANDNDFILFDVMVNGFYLDYKNMVDIANKLGLKYVPIVFCGTLLEAIDFVKNAECSTINKEHELEGIVLRPKGIELYNKKNERICLKCKKIDIKF